MIIKNKKVVFVGGCPNIMGKGKGELIDNYDIVVRSNGGFPVQKHLIDDYGQRCDIWTVNNQFKRYMLRHDYDVQGPRKLTKGDLSPLFQEFSHIEGLLMGPMIWTWILRQEPKELYITGIDFMLSKSTKYKPFDYPEYYDGYLPKEIQVEGNAVKEKNCNGHNILDNNKYILSLFKAYPNFVTDNTVYDMLIDYVRGSE
jgi:hypothetical protein